MNILLIGPQVSGKTTTAHVLAKCLRMHGCTNVAIADTYDPNAVIFDDHPGWWFIGTMQTLAALGYNGTDADGQPIVNEELYIRRIRRFDAVVSCMYVADSIQLWKVFPVTHHMYETARGKTWLIGEPTAQLWETAEAMQQDTAFAKGVKALTDALLVLRKE